jgi:hypothetical protein
MVAASKIFAPDSRRSNISRQIPSSISRRIIDSVSVATIVVHIEWNRVIAKCRGVRRGERLDTFAVARGHGE